MTHARTLNELAQERILILDGAWGTMFQRENLTEADYRRPDFAWDRQYKGNHDLLQLTRPDLLRKIHALYFEAGADITKTNTFSSTVIAQADYGLEHLVDELNVEAARIAREVADEFEARDGKPRFVAGSIGPTNRTATLSPDVERPEFRAVTYDELHDAYAQQIRGLLKGGADLLLIETIFDTLNAKAALFAVETVFSELGRRVPVMVSGTITDASGRTLSGQTPEAFAVSVAHARPFSLGLNCALGADHLRPYLREIAGSTESLVSVHPNAGLPNAFGEYEELPEHTAEVLRTFAEEGLLNIVAAAAAPRPSTSARSRRRWLPTPRAAPGNSRRFCA